MTRAPIIACALLFASPVRAEEPPETAAWLARLYVSESGWDSPDDRTAIFHVLRNRQRVLGTPTLLAAMRRYSSVLFESRRERRRWVQSLREDGGAPRRWPATLSWLDYTDRWKALLEEARGHLREAPPNPCSGTPDHWGGPHVAVDRERIRRGIANGHWRRLRCGVTRNVFLEVRR